MQAGLRTFCTAILLAAALIGLRQTRAQDAEITIARKPGQEDGQAQRLVKGKVQKVAPHAVAAWTVRGGEAALIIVLKPAKGHEPRQYQLRYYDLNSGRRRYLGNVPFSAATIKETGNKGEGWAFALTGNDRGTSKPVTVVGDEEAIPGLLPEASSPVFHESSLTFEENGGQKNLSLGVLLGTDLDHIYVPPQNQQSAPKYIQVFPDGTTIVEAQDGKVHDGEWHTDGHTLALVSVKGVPEYSTSLSQLTTVEGVPAAQKVVVRLTQVLSSRTAREGDVVKAVSISPVSVEGKILIPSNSLFEGTVVQANGVGWGFKHETASMTIDWTKATLPEGRELPLTARVFQVENAKESVKNGKIKSVRATATPGHSAENGVLTFAGIDPIAYIFAQSAGSAVLGFAETEILYNAGTELILETQKPLLTTQAYPPTVEPAADTEAEKNDLQAFVKSLPFRTKTKGSNKDSDVTNLVFEGSPAALERAFKAAGWVPSEDLTASSTFKTLKTVSGNQTYTQAPMSVLLLDEQEPIFTLSKSTNTFSSRHHLRVFPTSEKRDGLTVMTASSTQDIGIAFSKKQKTFIHVIDEHIDNERSKIVNDLVFTGCVESLDMVNRPWVPRDAYNSTGDRLRTDGAAAVLRLNSCEHPKSTADTVAEPPDRFQRATRDTTLTIKNGFYRGNLIYQGISGGIKVHDFFRSSSELPENYGSWRKTDASGAQYKGPAGSPDLKRRQSGGFNEAPNAADLAAMEKAREDHRWDPPRYEFALEGGYMHMRENYLTTVAVFYESSVITDPYYELYLTDVVDDGWAAGGTVTLNSWSHFSSEFSYFREQIKYELQQYNYTAVLNSAGTGYDEDESLEADRIGLVTRQFEYNLLFHARPPRSRWRPYGALGPAFQLIALNGAPLKKPAGPFTLGLKNIGLIKAAFDFGNTPPLDGGGIFQFGLQYGGGIKYRVSPRVMLRADFRETWSKNPDIISSSYSEYSPPDLDDTYETTVIRLRPDKKFLQDRYTLGVAFTF
jgi:hypothetical protein